MGHKPRTLNTQLTTENWIYTSFSGSSRAFRHYQRSSIHLSSSHGIHSANVETKYNTNTTNVPMFASTILLRSSGQGPLSIN